jgi:hypothetical protein
MALPLAGNKDEPLVLSTFIFVSLTRRQTKKHFEKSKESFLLQVRSWFGGSYISEREFI